MRDDTTHGRSNSNRQREQPKLADGGAEPSLLASDDGRASWFANMLVEDRVTAEDTGGAYSLTEHRIPPGGETPYHVHHDEEEVVYVVEGELSAVTEDGSEPVTEGQTVVVPRGAPHGLRATGEEPATILVICSPPGLEEFFHEAGEPAAARELPEPSEPDVERMGALAPDYGLELLGPLPE